RAILERGQRFGAGLYAKYGSAALIGRWGGKLALGIGGAKAALLGVGIPAGIALAAGFGINKLLQMHQKRRAVALSGDIEHYDTMAKMGLTSTSAEFSAEFLQKMENNRRAASQRMAQAVIGGSPVERILTGVGMAESEETSEARTEAERLSRKRDVLARRFGERFLKGTAIENIKKTHAAEIESTLKREYRQYVELGGPGDFEHRAWGADWVKYVYGAARRKIGEWIGETRAIEERAAFRIQGNVMAAIEPHLATLDPRIGT
ncbi:unnamed protein product, partial [marine sediment metagenome]